MVFRAGLPCWVMLSAHIFFFLLTPLRHSRAVSEHPCPNNSERQFKLLWKVCTSHPSPALNRNAADLFLHFLLCSGPTIASPPQGHPSLASQQDDDEAQARQCAMTRRTDKAHTACGETGPDK
ncbi:hypothetical protein BD779DRAFT_239429 [Infundibulicybe gibba]|nr:hypothetical protein BD779DRAFT_239429 [Infundibulicybe gibba]